MRSPPASLFDPASTGPAAPPAALVEAARALEVLSPSERRCVLRNEAGLLLDGLLARVARGRSAVDVALCEGLGALSVGDGALRLGFSGVGDYARERLGLAARTGQSLARLGRALAARPLLLAAVRSGEVSLRAALAVLPVATGADEAAWVERARSMTVRGLLAAVRGAAEAVKAGAEVGSLDAASGCAGAGALDSVAACAGVDGAAAVEAPGAAAGPGGGLDGGSAGGCGGPEPDDDDGPDAEPWQRVVLEVDTGARDALERALDLAGQVLGEEAPRWQRVEALAQEFLGAHGGGGSGGDGLGGRGLGGDAPGGDRPGAPGGAAEAEGDAVAGLLAAWRGDGPGTASPWASGAWQSRGGFSRGSPRSGRAGLFGDDPGWRERLEAFLEEETERWSFLDRVAPVVAPSIDADVPPEALDAALRHLAALRERWESLLGHLALLFRMSGLWRDAQFTSFAHYCRERLGLGVRQVEARIALERRLHALPRLRAALDEGRLDAERARLVARVADADDEARWIDRAAEVPAMALQREVEAAEAHPPVPWAVAARLCAPELPPAEVRLRLPVRVATLLAEAMLAARRVAGVAVATGCTIRPRTDAECLRLVAEHFLAAWSALPRARSTPQRRALRRDQHRCQVPGCSRRAAHAHHVRFRSHGGGDDEANLVSLCAAHHLHGVHRGFLRVRGVAPHALTWEVVALGERWGPGAGAGPTEGGATTLAA